MNHGDVVADRFVVDRAVGRGGMGSVYRALDRETGTTVALKIVHDAANEQRFLDEARVLARIHDPAIVDYVAHGRTSDGIPFLAIEWLDGEDLACRLARAPLSVDESLALAERVARGLGAAHTSNVIHRDIKPSNVFLVGNDPTTVKILDFGIARASDRTRITQTGAVIGTPGYMAPEQARGDREITPAADVFSLGCVVFECLTGQPPFAGSSLIATLAKVLLEQAPELGEVCTKFRGSALEEIVGKMLAKDARERMPNGHVVAEALRCLDPAQIAGSDSVATGRLGTDEVRLVSLILIRPATGSEAILRSIAARFGVELATLRVGVSLLAFPPGERAVEAARCALALATELPDAAIALSTGRSQVAGRGPIGTAIERASELLPDHASIRIDDVTAGLLPPRFEVSRGTLVGERVRFEPRMLLGRPTPCVGRDKELAMLEATWRECVEDEVARSVLATGAPGIGKSRLAIEVCTRIAATGNVLVARADPMTAGSALSMARDLVRRSGPVHDEFLAELAGEPVAAPSEHLRAARAEPAIMREQKRRAFVEWVGRQLDIAPLLLVLEDLHWGDVPSVGYVEHALRAHADRSLMVFALARPEIREELPRLWAGVVELPLRALTRRASERLIHAVLGDAIGDDTCTRLAVRADGNPFFLEELIRLAADGRAEHVPETALAMIDARLDRLSAETRRVLRAASVFGETFSRAGVEALVGPADLDVLVAEELVTAGDHGELRFRHALVRDAVYATLVDEDKARAHLLAAEWLERNNARDARLLAEHWERALEPERALPWIVRAARDLFEAGDLDGTNALAEHGLQLGATGETRGGLLLIRGLVLGFQERWPEGITVAFEARGLVPATSADWWLISAGLLLAAHSTGRHEVALEAVGAMMRAPWCEPTPQLAWAGSIIVAACTRQLDRRVATLMLARLPERSDADAGYRGLRSRAAFYYERAFGNRLDELWRHASDFHAAVAQLGHPLWTVLAFIDLGIAEHEQGAHARAVETLREASARGERTGTTFLAAYAAVRLAWAAFDAGDSDIVVERAITAARASETDWILAEASAAEAALQLRRGRMEEAMMLARAAEPDAALHAVPILAELDLVRNDFGSALARIEPLLPNAPVFYQARRVTLLTLRAEALFGLDRVEEARASRAAATELADVVAMTGRDDVQRASYLAKVSTLLRRRSS